MMEVAKWLLNCSLKAVGLQSVCIGLQLVCGLSVVGLINYIAAAAETSMWEKHKNMASTELSNTSILL